MNNVFTPESQDKLARFYQQNRITLTDQIKYVLRQMIDASNVPLNYSLIRSVTKRQLQNIFTKFDRDVNFAGPSPLKRSVEEMHSVLSYELHEGRSTIQVHFLYDEEAVNVELMAQITNAIHLFINMYRVNANGLEIFICLDCNERRLPNIQSISASDFIHENPTVFNASGMTVPAKKRIVLTKQEEIIKLLFHELVHFARIDHPLFTCDPAIINLFNWSVEGEFQFTEVYAEFLAIILNGCFQSISLSLIERSYPEDILSRILALEATYSVVLSAKILQFYGITTKEDLNRFFSGDYPRQFSPIAIWEYVIMRTQLLLNLGGVETVTNSMMEIVDCDGLVKLMLPTGRFEKRVVPYLTQDLGTSISYNIIDIDWPSYWSRLN